MWMTPGAIAEDSSVGRDETPPPLGLPATRIGLLSRSSTDVGGFHPTPLQIPFVDQNVHSVGQVEFKSTTAMVVSCTTEPPLSAARESCSCRRALTSHWRSSTCIGPNWILSCCICATRDCNRWLKLGCPIR